MGMTRLLAALLLFAGPVLAEPAYLATPDFPLPVRDAPDGDEVDALPPATRVETTGEQGGWVRVPLAESDAWAARDALQPVEVSRLAGSALPEGLVCTGTEPFWALHLSTAGSRYEEPGAQPEPLALVSAAAADGFQRFPVLMTLMRGQTAVLAVIRPEACTDGMSDRTQPWRADVILQGSEGGAVPTLRSGCCRLPPAPQ